ncbi:MAG: hypothetical protein K9L82_03530 [Chromatiaceae bacterium]|nr:hypothetical protein [Chromatiaceae bacterium]MCF8016533.1 hypothetical protein [Chromatiaceae bacterium]
MAHMLLDDKKADQARKNHNSRISKVALGTATLALALSATATLATPTLTIDNMQQVGSVEFSFSENSREPFLIGYDNVNLRFDYDYDPDKWRNKNDLWQNVSAGAFDGEAQSTGKDDFDITTLYRNQDQVILYCLDIFNDLETVGFVEYSVYAFDDDAAGDPTTTTQITQDETETEWVWRGRRQGWQLRETTIPGITATGNLNNVLDFLGALNDVLSETDYWVEEDDGWVQNGTYNFGDRNWLNPANWLVSGAIQVGIWESLYDDDMDLDTGHFSVTGLSRDGEALLNTTFQRMASSNPLDRSQVLLFQPVTGGQTLIGDPVDVPAPGTLVLLLSGLFLVRKVSRGSR